MIQKTLKKMACMGIFIILTGALCGCSKAEVPALKIKSEDVAGEYNMVEVDYGDVVLEQQISCLYSQIEEESLSFSIEKRELTHIYVSDGDTVKEGQLLAKLNVDDLEKKLRDNEDKIEQCDLLISETQKLVDYYESLLRGSIGLKRREEIEFKISDALQQLDELKNQKETCIRENDGFREIIDKSALYAGMDGTVSNINKAMVGTRPSKGSVVMKIINTDHCSFVSRDEKAFELLEVGDSVRINITDDKYYDATVIEKETDGGRVIMDLDEPDYSIKMSTRGTINIELERADNVLSLPREAVHTTENMAYVYTLSESGVRELREVEIGIMGTKLVEIKSGLLPYEQVILRKGIRNT